MKAELEAPEAELESLRFAFLPRMVSGNDVILASGLQKSFDEKKLFAGVELHIRRGDRAFLLGPNGCGKTTIGKLIAGLYRPSGGRIMLFGKSQNPKQLQKQVLFILQEAEFQFFTGSVLHELQYGHAVTAEFEAKTERC